MSRSSGHGLEVEQRHAEFVRGRDGNVAGLGRAAADQLGHEMRFLFARGRERRKGVRLADDPVLHQALGQTAEQPPGRGAVGQRNVLAHVLTIASTVLARGSLLQVQIIATVKSLPECDIPRRRPP